MCTALLASIAALALPACQVDCMGGQAMCVGSEVVACVETGDYFERYRWEPWDCAAVGKECVQRGNGATCGARDARCDGEPRCDGNTVLHCERGYLLREEACSDGRVCKSLASGVGVCADPNHPCYEHADGWLCDDDEAYRCAEGIPAEYAGCRSCVMSDDGQPYSTSEARSCT
jgi:hypothetical protein